MKHAKSIFILMLMAALTVLTVNDVMARGGFCGGGGYGMNQQGSSGNTNASQTMPCQTGNNVPGCMQGKGGMGGPGNGMCPRMGVNILDGEPVTVSGTVSEIGIGKGVSVDTGTEVVTIYGMGACRYTEELGITQIDVGDTITVNGYKIAFGENDTRVVAMSVTKDGVEVQLRDSETGAPLWRPFGKGITGQGSAGIGPVNILEGTPVTVSGKVSQAGFGPSISVDNGTEVVAVYGIGHYPYWDSLGIARPAVGDQITVEGYQVTFSDSSIKTIAMKVTVNGVDVQLRDAETGAPLWRRVPKAE